MDCLVALLVSRVPRNDRAYAVTLSTGLAPDRGQARLPPMLVEFPNVKQEGGANRRRWFQGDGLELIVWYGTAGTPQGFQICYIGQDRQERERVHGAPHKRTSRSAQKATPIAGK